MKAQDLIKQLDVLEKDVLIPLFQQLSEKEKVLLNEVLIGLQYTVEANQEQVAKKEKIEFLLELITDHEKSKKTVDLASKEKKKSSIKKFVIHSQDRYFLNIIKEKIIFIEKYSSSFMADEEIRRAIILNIALVGEIMKNIYDFHNQNSSIGKSILENFSMQKFQKEYYTRVTKWLLGSFWENEQKTMVLINKALPLIQKFKKFLENVFDGGQPNDLSDEIEELTEKIIAFGKELYGSGIKDYYITLEMWCSRMLTELEFAKKYISCDLEKEIHFFAAQHSLIIAAESIRAGIPESIQQDNPCDFVVTGDQKKDLWQELINVRNRCVHQWSVVDEEIVIATIKKATDSRFFGILKKIIDSCKAESLQSGHEGSQKRKPELFFDGPKEKKQGLEGKSTEFACKLEEKNQDLEVKNTEVDHKLEEEKQKGRTTGLPKI